MNDSAGVPVSGTMSSTAVLPDRRVAVVEEPGAEVSDRVCWSTVAGLGLIHVAAIVGVIWLVVNPSVPTLVLAGVMFWLCGMAITAGYHRLFAHRTYRASPPVRWAMLAFGAATFQNSALSWSADHRAHHADTDGDSDPHAVTRGVWFAHVGWLFRRRVASADVRRLGDLWSVRSIRWQHRCVPGRGIGIGLLVPMALAATWGIRGAASSSPGSSAPRHAAGDVLHQLARPHPRNAAVRPAVVGARQHAHRARHVRRGLPQLPPPVPVRLSQRRPLVALRPEQVADLDDGPHAAGHRRAIGVAVHDRPGRRNEHRTRPSAET